MARKSKEALIDEILRKQSTPTYRTYNGDRACGANNQGNGECDTNCNTLQYNWDNGDCCPDTCIGWDGLGTEPCGELTPNWNICHDPCSQNNVFTPPGTTCDCGDCMLWEGSDASTPSYGACCCDGVSVADCNDCPGADCPICSLATAVS